MSAGFWINNDGLAVQYGTQKVIPELGGDFLMYGENREVEAYISIGQTTFGQGGPNSFTIPALPGSFTGTSTPIAAGIQSMTTLFPLQLTPPILTASGGNGLLLTTTQLWIDQIDLEVLVTASAGAGTATALTGIGLVTTNPTSNSGVASAFVQVTPNPGVQLLGAGAGAAFTNLTSGKHWTYYSDGSTFGSATPPTAGSWLGNVPQVTNTITPLPTNAWISTIANGTITGTTAAGLLKLRIRYNIYGSISQ